ncbi:reductase AKOR2 [Lentinula raphanica]|uniref:Reductase AKOR2 n=1 Tax=Lentinula raphanica TaxID=153919 RepID=A0AA38NXK9_9AGAR|nr:NADP-dependent oxidoreductase domain-containing protein [Lentinula raphanica]KAJ3769685.1 reductase AKOR2 [Lentinula raphanica]KAJ3820515.1 reductase AKOR2 [Lentinula raphanica]KAJ3832505.1 reductase AKOR2 [Lentinula raphanica]KAJ3976526.1 reductase AKOR2 [Lentinula raphanica]
MPFTVKDKVLLSSGIEMPVIANGSWAPPTGNARAEVRDWTLTALKAGYRHIDTALGYGTEKSVGLAIKESGLKREDVFITTKLPYTDHSRVQDSFNESLTNLGVDYIDLYLVHWPQCIASEDADGTLKLASSITFVEVWAQMEKIFEGKKAKAIGVSNFSIKNLEILLKSAKIVPAVNQVELHPYLAQNELKQYCKDKGIIIEAYTPSGYSKVRSDPVIQNIAKKLEATPNQVILAWHLFKETVIVPKSANEERQRENLNLPVLSKEDVEQIDALDHGERICNKPDQNGLVWGWTMEQLGW